MSVSVPVGLGSALLLGELVSHVAVWAVAPFVAGAAYLITKRVETAVAEWALVRMGDAEADEVSG